MRHDSIAPSGNGATMIQPSGAADLIIAPRVFHGEFFDNLSRKWKYSQVMIH
jgi:hypothetical protein